MPNVSVIRTPPPRRFKWFERATIAGILISIGVHLALMLLAGVLNVQFKFGDAGGDQGEGVEFAILNAEDLAEMTTPRIEVETVDTEISALDATTDMELLADLNTELSVDDLADSIAPNLSPGGGALTGIDPGTGSARAGSGSGASFFGLEAEGTRFAYIVDRSGSMNTLTGKGELTRWELTRNELIRSLMALDPGADFIVELYSGSAVSLFGIPNWVRATPPNKVSANAALMLIDPNGSTYPITVLKHVFAGLDPPPDAIYLMTDGEFGEGDNVPEQIKAMNRGKGVPVHCILFGEPGGTADDTRRVISTMQLIARTSGGKFTHIREGKP